MADVAAAAALNQTLRAQHEALLGRPFLPMDGPLLVQCVEDLRKDRRGGKRQRADEGAAQRWVTLGFVQSWGQPGRGQGCEVFVFVPKQACACRCSIMYHVWATLLQT